MNRSAFYAALRKTWGGFSHPQVRGFERYLDRIAQTPALPINHSAYVLATVWHETGTRMQPVRETFASTDDQAVARLNAAWNAGRLSWVKTPYWQRDARGRSWYGRGDVQITHAQNYENLGTRLGIPLARSPDLALDPQVAMEIAWVGMTEGLFTGKRLADYLTADKTEYVSARRIVNGVDRAKRIAGEARLFESALRAAR